jgi:hypothetical protein
MQASAKRPERKSLTNHLVKGVMTPDILGSGQKVDI